MSSVKVKQLQRALEKKGYQLEENDHHFYRLYDENGKKTKIRTKISHGETEIKDPLINAMRKQMHFAKKGDFLNYVACSLSKEEYYDILREQNLI